MTGLARSPAPRGTKHPPPRVAGVRRRPRLAGHCAAGRSVVDAGQLTRERVDAGGTRLRLRALHVMGHGSARLARAIGRNEQVIQRIVRGDASTVSHALRDAVARLYDAWWDKRPPERTRAERAAASAARRRARNGNWCAPAWPRRRPARRPRLSAATRLAARPRHEPRHRAHQEATERKAAA